MAISSPTESSILTSITSSPVQVGEAQQVEGSSAPGPPGGANLSETGYISSDGEDVLLVDPVSGIEGHNFGGVVSEVSSGEPVPDYLEAQQGAPNDAVQLAVTEEAHENQTEQPTLGSSN